MKGQGCSPCPGRRVLRLRPLAAAGFIDDLDRHQLKQPGSAPGNPDYSKSWQGWGGNAEKQKVFRFRLWRSCRTLPHVRKQTAVLLSGNSRCIAARIPGEGTALPGTPPLRAAAAARKMRFPLEIASLRLPWSRGWGLGRRAPFRPPAPANRPAATWQPQERGTPSPQSRMS